MKAKIPKSWQSLPEKEKDVLKGYMVDICEREVEKDARIILELYIKMVCVVLHDGFGWGESRLYRFLGNHKRLFARQCKLVKNDEQREYLDRRMQEIFKNDGFPKDFFDNMLGEVGKSNADSYTIFGAGKEAR